MSHMDGSIQRVPGQPGMVVSKGAKQAGRRYTSDENPGAASHGDGEYKKPPPAPVVVPNTWAPALDPSESPEPPRPGGI